MFESKKNVFWEALVITIFIFGIGILFGVFLENSRADKISNLYLTSELNLLDIQIQTRILDSGNFSCEQAISENLKFADKVYDDAKLLQEYEDASRISDNLIQQHKRYDLLRVLLWLDSVKIKNKCGGDSFHTIVYLYNYQPEDASQKNQQVVFSRFLEEIKSEYGSKVILIPIAKNLDSSSLNFLLKNYNIQEVSILVDEKVVISDVGELEKIKDYLGT